MGKPFMNKLKGHTYFLQITLMFYKCAPFLRCALYQGEGIMDVISWLMQTTTEVLVGPSLKPYDQILFHLLPHQNFS